MKPFWMFMTVFAVLLISSGAFAQNGQDPPGEDDAVKETAAPILVPDELRSPVNTFDTFLRAMVEKDYEKAKSCLVISGAAQDRSKLIADQLDLIINTVEYETENLSFFDTMIPTLEIMDKEQRTSFQYFPRVGIHDSIRRRTRAAGTIVIEKQTDGTWLFSESTCDGIGELYEELRSIIQISDEQAAQLSFPLWIENKLPETLTNNKALGLKYWQWLGLLILIFAGMLFDFFLRAVLGSFARRIISRQGGEAAKETLKKTVRPFGLCAAAIFWLYTLELLGLPVGVLKFLSPVVKFFAMLASVWAAYRVTDLISEVFANRAALTHTKVDDLLIPLLRKTMKVFITVMGIIYIANSLNIEILPLLTGLGIGSLALAFAAKDTIENFFGSVAVIVDRPFEVGDSIKVGDVVGTVEELGFRSTRVRTFYNSQVTIPNATLVRATVDNMGRRKYRRWNTHLNLTYDTSPEKIESFCEGVRELIRVHPYTRKDYYQVWLNEFGAHSLDILIYIFFEVPDWQTELRERERLMLDIMRLADHLGVEFAFPTQTLHLFKEDTETEHIAADIPDHDPTGRAQQKGRLAVKKITEHATWQREKPGAYEVAPRSVTSSDDDEGEDETQIETKAGGE